MEKNIPMLCPSAINRCFLEKSEYVVEHNCYFEFYCNTLHFIAFML